MLSHIQKIALFYIFTFPMQINAASFDCKKASIKVEKEICASKEISGLDDALTATYKIIQTQTSNLNTLKKDQIKWIKERNLCSHVDCIKTSYLKRITQLKNMHNKSTPLLTEKFNPTPPNLSAKSAEPLARLGYFSEFRPQYRTVKFQNGKLYFSQYGKSGNNYDVVAIDIDSQSVEYLAREHKDAVFIAENDHYVVIQTRDETTNPLVVLDKKDGTVLGKLKINRSVDFGYFSGEKLVSIQSGTNNNYLVFSLPDLKILKSVDTKAPIKTDEIIRWNKNFIISVQGGIGIFYDKFSAIKYIKYETIKNSRKNNCHGNPVTIVGEKAISVSNCGQIHIYNLTSMSWEKSIPPYDSFYSLAPYGTDFLFTAPITASTYKNKTHIFNIKTGKEVAIVPIDGSYLFTTNKYLLTLSYESKKNPSITIYTINNEALASENHHLENISSACTKAAEIAKTGDIYQAIDLCESAGIADIARNEEEKPELTEHIKAYGEWLSMTYSRASESIEILERFLTDSDSAQIQQRIVEAKLKSRYFSENPNVKSPTTTENPTPEDILSENELNTHFGKIVSQKTIKENEVAIDFGSFSDLFYFDDDKVYVGKWDTAVTLHIYNRKDFTLIKNIIIEATADSESQPIITSIASDSFNIYASISRRWEDESNIDFVVIDKNTLKIIKKVAIGAKTLFSHQEKIYSCNCDLLSKPHCNSINPSTLILTPEESLFCKYPFIHRSSALGKANTTSILAADFGDLYPALPQSEYPKITIINDRVKLNYRIVIKQSETTNERALLDLNYASNSSPTFLLNGKNLFIGNGRDLLIYDTENYRLKNYMKNFISDKEDNTKCCIDFNRISRMIFDQNRLIVLTQNGIKSKIVAIEE